MPLKALQDSTLTDSREWQSFANTALSTLAQKELESSNAKNDIEWKSFKIGELFEINTGRDVIIGKTPSGNIPLISHQNTNNGVVKYIKKLEYRRLFNHKNTIALADRGVFYATTQNQNFHIGTRVKALIFKEKSISKNVRLFFVATINKLQIKFTEYSQNATDKLPNEKISLPVYIDSQNINFNFMESFIKAIEKQHIETLYRFWESKLKVYNAVINGGGG